MTVVENQTPFKVPPGEEDYLKWTPLDTEYEENAEEGNRWHRASPMFSDGECIYMLVQYRKKDFGSPIVKTVLEVFDIDMEHKTMTRIHEQKLYKNDQGDYYKGSGKNKDKGGHMARGSIACNQEVLLWWSAHNFHVYEYATGKRKRKEYVNSTSYVTCWDPVEQWYYYQDCCSYAWLKRCKITNYKNRVISKVKEKNLPEIPILFDTYKSDIIKQIREEEKKEVPVEDDEEEKKDAEEEKKDGEEAKEEKKTQFVIIKKKDPRNDLLDILALSTNDEIFDVAQPEQEERQRKTEPIANISQIC